MTGLDGQVGRGRVLGFSCSVLAQIRDTHSQTIAYQNEKEKQTPWGVCVYMCSSMQPDQGASKAVSDLE